MGSNEISEIKASIFIIQKIQRTIQFPDIYHPQNITSSRIRQTENMASHLLQSRRKLTGQYNKHKLQDLSSSKQTFLYQKPKIVKTVLCFLFIHFVNKHEYQCDRKLPTPQKDIGVKDLLYLERFQTQHLQTSTYQPKTKLDKAFPRVHSHQKSRYDEDLN